MLKRRGGEGIKPGEVRRGGNRAVQPKEGERGYLGGACWKKIVSGRTLGGEKWSRKGRRK